MRDLETGLPALSEALNEVLTAEAECNAANVDENDYTVFTYQDLQFELELAVQSISKKIAFLDNQVSLLCEHLSVNPPDLYQIVSRNMSNLTPAQLEQFESTFRYFDRDESNTLNQYEMAAALASLGIVYSVGFCRVLLYSSLMPRIGSRHRHDLRPTFARLRRRDVRSFYQPPGEYSLLHIENETHAHSSAGRDHRGSNIS